MIWRDANSRLRVAEMRLPTASIELVRASAGVALLDHHHPRAHLLAVLDGELNEEGQVYRRGDLRVSPASDRHFMRFNRESICLVIEMGVGEKLDWIERRHHWHAPEAFASVSRLARTTTEEEAAEILDDVTGQIMRRLLPDSRRKVPGWLGQLLAHAQSMHGAASAQQLARDAGVSREHLSRSFSRHYQTSLVSYLRRQRIARAFRQICRTKHPLAQIAYECGFADQSHMTRVFALEFGLTPRVIRLRAEQSG